MSINSNVEYLVFLHQCGVSTFLKDSPNNFYLENNPKPTNNEGLINNLDENSYSELIKLKNQLNRE